MALTGAGVLIANSSGLGQSEGQPRGLDSDGDVFIRAWECTPSPH